MPVSRCTSTSPPSMRSHRAHQVPQVPSNRLLLNDYVQRVSEPSYSCPPMINEPRIRCTSVTLWNGHSVLLEVVKIQPGPSLATVRHKPLLPHDTHHCIYSLWNTLWKWPSTFKKRCERNSCRGYLTVPPTPSRNLSTQPLLGNNPTAPS